MSNDIIRVNSSEEAVTDNVDKFVTSTTHPSLNPIDEYLDQVTKLIIGSATADSDILQLYLLGLVSAAERFFRRVLSGVINLCEQASEVAARQQLSFGAMNYFAADLGYGLLENSSLSGDGEIKKRTRSLVGFSIQDNTSLDHALTEFEKICQLRHATIHSGGELSAKNALELDLPLTNRLSVSITSITFQSIALRCHNAVRAYNQYLFSEIISRWIHNEVLTGEWSRDVSRFEPCYKFFASTKDLNIEKNPRIAHEKLAKAVRERFVPESNPSRKGKGKVPSTPRTTTSSK